MTPSRWLIVVAAIVILGVVGGTVWRGSSHKEESEEGQTAEGRSAKSSKRSGFRSDRRRTNPEDWPAIDPIDGIGLDELPPHLRALVLDVERLADSVSQDYTWAALLGVRAKLKPRLDELTVEELSLLVRFYREHNVDWEVRGADFVVPEFYRLLGQKEPEGASRRILAAVDDYLGVITSGLDFSNAARFDQNYRSWAYIYEGWASLDPQAALAGWERLRNDLERREDVVGVGHLDGRIRPALIRGWAAHDPKAAGQHLVESIGPNTPSLIEGYFDGLQPDAPWSDLVSTFHTELGEDFEDFIPEALGLWAVVDHEAMFSWMEGKDLNPDGLHAGLFEEWYRHDATSTAVDWLRDNASSLTAEIRVEAVGSALAYQTHRLEEVLPIVNSLAPDTRTWNLICELADVRSWGITSERFSVSLKSALPTLQLYQIRPILDQLDAPDELRQRIEEAYARRARRATNE